jgi:hypothetical protein
MGVVFFSLCASERTGLDAGVAGVAGVDGVDGVDVGSTEEDVEVREEEGGLSHVVSPVPPKLGSLK